LASGGRAMDAQVIESHRFLHMDAFIVVFIPTAGAMAKPRSLLVNDR